MKKSLLVSFTFVISLPLWAAEQTITLGVPGMTCSACPITVKTTLKRVEGVRQVDVSFEQREARVTFEDTQTSVTELTDATANAGYPSTLKQSSADQK